MQTRNAGSNDSKIVIEKKVTEAEKVFNKIALELDILENCLQGMEIVLSKILVPSTKGSDKLSKENADLPYQTIHAQSLDVFLTKLSNANNFIKDIINRAEI